MRERTLPLLSLFALSSLLRALSGEPSAPHILPSVFQIQISNPSNETDCFNPSLAAVEGKGTYVVVRCVSPEFEAKLVQYKETAFHSKAYLGTLQGPVREKKVPLAAVISAWCNFFKSLLL
jgi:hypothetical protein